MKYRVVVSVKPITGVLIYYVQKKRKFLWWSYVTKSVKSPISSSQYVWTNVHRTWSTMESAEIWIKSKTRTVYLKEYS